ncbi:MAG: putative maltokinase [Saprospiraceae bacterium]
MTRLPANFSFDHLTDPLSEAAARLTENALPGFFPRHRWFTSKGSTIKDCAIAEAHALGEDYLILVVELTYAAGEPRRELYQLPVARITDPERIEYYKQEKPRQIIAGTDTLILVDAVHEPDFRDELFRAMRDRRGDGRGLNFEAGAVLGAETGEVSSRALPETSSNTALLYNDNYFFKLFRKLERALNPDLELIRFLSDRTEFQNCPRYGGSVTVGSEGTDEYINLGLLLNKIDNRGDAWEWSQAELAQTYRRQLERGNGAPPADYSEAAALNFMGEAMRDRIALLGKRTAEMHLALASDREDDDFLPEPLTADYREELYRAARRIRDEKLAPLKDRLADLPAAVRPIADEVLARWDEMNSRLEAILQTDFTALLTRIHGDYHLGQVLVTDDDFAIIDFEGEPLLTIPERRRKRPPYKDVAGMLRSLHYAAEGCLLLDESFSDEERAALRPWSAAWVRLARATYLDAYHATAGDADFLPADPDQRRQLLAHFSLEKAMYEVAYELNSRPDWLSIPLRGVLDSLAEE